jgi:low density lipoprotein receptor-related protein 5/6
MGLSPAQAADVYWVDSGAVWRADVDSGVAEQVIGAAEAEASGGGLDLDPSGGKVYWTAYIADQFVAMLRRANLDGSDIDSFGGGGKNSLGDVALDLDNDKLYYTDPSDCVPGCGSLRRAELDGSNEEALIVLDVPGALAVDPDLGTVCWGDSFNDWIQCATLDGNDAVTSVETTPNGLALDPNSGSLYWTDPAGGRIRRSDLDSTDVIDVVTGLDDPYGIVLDSATGRMYWSDRGAGKIQRANLDGSGVEDVVTGLGSPQGLALDVEGVPPDPVPALSGIGLIVATLLLLLTASTAVLFGRRTPTRSTGSAP